MKAMLSACIGVFFLATSLWQPDFITAQKVAKEKHRLILLNFSGSDWCLPCMRMRKNIFDNPSFITMADTCLVLYNADFPRQKKNALSKALVNQHDSLAAQYNPEGKFPFTVLLTAEGKVIKSWEGYPDQPAAEFSRSVQLLCNANKP